MNDWRGLAVFTCLLLVGCVHSALAADGGWPLRQWSWRDWSTDAGLPQISVNAVRRGADGRVWIATENGLARFDGVGFEVFRVSSTPAMASNWITCLHVDRRGDVWIGTQGNLLRWDGEDFAAVTLPASSVAVVAIADDA